MTKCIDLPKLQSLHHESQVEIPPNTTLGHLSDRQISCFIEEANVPPESKSNTNSCDRNLTETEEVCGGGVHGQTVAERSQDMENHETGVGPPGILAKKTGRPPDRFALREGKVESMVRKLEPRRGENKVVDEKGMESKVLEMVKLFEPEDSKKRIILTPRRRKPDGLSNRSIVEFQGDSLGETDFGGGGQVACDVSGVRRQRDHLFDEEVVRNSTPRRSRRKL